MDQVRERIAQRISGIAHVFSIRRAGGRGLNQGAPAPIDVQVSGIDLQSDDRVAQDLARQFQALPGISDVYIPQDMDYPALQVNVNRERASELGLIRKEVIDNLITSLTSDAMIAPATGSIPRAATTTS